MKDVIDTLQERDPIPETDPIPEISSAQNSSQADRVRMAMRFVEANASGPVSLEQVAEHVGWSKWHCARVFKRHTGSGIAEFCRHVRVNTARRLLAERTLTIKEVAAAAGFTRASDLTRCFLQAYGVSPSRFRSGQPIAAALESSTPPWSFDRALPTSIECTPRRSTARIHNGATN